MAIASLVVNLQANTAAFASAMGRARTLALGNMKDIERAGKILGTALLALGAAAAAGLGVLVKQSIDAADALGKMQKKTGVSTESLSVLKHAAELSGASMEQVVTALSRLAKNAFEAASGNKEAQESFRQLGVEVTDAEGRLRSTEAIFLDVVEAVGKIENPTARAALAQKTLGKSAAELLPLLQSLAKGGFEATRKEAEALGLVISGKTAQAAEQFNDNLQRLGMAGRGVANIIAAEAAPALANFTDALVDWVKQSRAVPQIAEGIIIIFKGIAGAAFAVLGGLEALGFAIRQLAAAALLLKDLDFKGAFQALKEGLTGVEGILAKTGERIMTLWRDQVPAAIKQSKPPMDFLIEQTEKLEDVWKRLGALAEAQLAAALRNVEINDKIAQEILKTAQARIDGLQTVIDLERQAQIERLKLEGKTDEAIVLETQARVAEVEAALRQQGLTEEEIARATAAVWQETNDQIAANTQKRTEEMAQQFSDFFDKILFSGRTFGSIIKDIFEEMKRFFIKQLLVMLARWLLTITKMREIFDKILGNLKIDIDLKTPPTFPAPNFDFRQHGGPVLPRRAFVVGEAGPELFIPSLAGRVEPIAAGKGQTVITIHFERGAIVSPGTNPRLVAAEVISQIRTRARDRGARMPF